MPRERFTGSRPVLPGRYVPKSGTLHRYPATEKCNLDDSTSELHVETMRGLKELPADTQFCQHCFNESEMAEIAGIWETGPEDKPDAEAEG